MTPEPNAAPPPQSQGYDLLGQAGRVEYRMLTDEQTLTPDLEHALVGELQDWRKDHPNPKDPGKPFPITALAERVGISNSALSEWLAGKYRGDNAAVARAADQFLADERQRAGRLDFRQHARIALTTKIFGVLNSAVKYNRMAAIVGPAGYGKTAHALAFQRERSGVLYLRIRESEDGATERDASDLLCDLITELRPMKSKPHRRRRDSIENWLRKRRNTVILVDEAQFLAPSGLEFFRTLHDVADPAGHHGLPIIFFGDEKFHSAVVRVKHGEKSAIAPQLARRMLLIFDIVTQGGAGPGGEGNVFTIEDICKIVRNERLHLLSAESARWLAKLANTPHAGGLGMAIDVLKMAVDLISSKGLKRVELAHLQMILPMSCGPELAEALDAAAGGELLERTG